MRILQHYGLFVIFDQGLVAFFMSILSLLSAYAGVMALLTLTFARG